MYTACQVGISVISGTGLSALHVDGTVFRIIVLCEAMQQALLFREINWSPKIFPASLHPPDVISLITDLVIIFKVLFRKFIHIYLTLGLAP